MDVLNIIKENNLKEIEQIDNLLPETKSLLKQYVNKFGMLFPIMKMTNYNNDIYIRLMKDAIEDDIPIEYEDIESEFANINWDVAKN